MQALKQNDVAQQLALLNERLDLLVEKQRERDALFDEMRPILKEVMSHSVGKFAELEEQGYFTFGREGMRVLDRIVESYDADDVRALGDNIVRIMDTVRAFTQPQLLSLVTEATEVIDNADKLEPTGVVGMVRASRDEDVQRGMAVFLDVLRTVGRGVKQMSDEKKPEKPRKRAKALPAAQEVAVVSKKKRKKKRKKTAVPVVIDGVEFDANGYLVDAAQWTPDLAANIGASLGLELNDRHWVAINAARQEFLASGASPNIRKLTSVCDVTTKELYKLFPRAPGMTVARVAGTPKPVGCI